MRPRPSSPDDHPETQEQQEPWGAQAFSEAGADHACDEEPGAAQEERVGGQLSAHEPTPRHGRRAIPADGPDLRDAAPRS